MYFCAFIRCEESKVTIYFSGMKCHNFSDTDSRFVNHHITMNPMKEFVHHYDDHVHLRLILLLINFEYNIFSWNKVYF